MKKFFLFICCFLVGFTLKTYAGNALASGLTYQCISPNTFAVTFRYVRDCDTQLAPNTIDLLLESSGCFVGRTVNLNKTGPSQTLLPYCPNVPVNCLPNGTKGPEEIVYSGVITFTSAEMNCADWRLAVTIPNDGRATTANLLDNAPFYTEAYLNLRYGINNNSPEYSPLNRPYKIYEVNQYVRYYLNAAEQDGDSLVYALISARQAANIPATYKNGFSAQNPIVTSSPFTFDPINGDLRFTPNVLLPTSNRYAVVVQVKEYRKINGLVQLVGITQRDIIFEISAPVNNNNLPQFQNFTANGQPFSPQIPVNATVGQPIQVQFDNFDADTADRLTLVFQPYLPSPGSGPFPGTITIINNGMRPSFSLTWTPTQNDVSNIPYRFPIKIEDSACPYKAVVTSSFSILVSSPTGLRKEQGDLDAFSVFPNPFTNEVSFKIESRKIPQTILIYNALGLEIDRIPVKTGPGTEQLVRWENAGKYAAGTYVARFLTANGNIQIRKFSKL